jgi:hypothetical protein
MRIQPTGSLVIDGKPQPANTTLVGYAALIKALNLPVPMPKTVSVVGEGKHRSDPGRDYALRTAMPCSSATMPSLPISAPT